jgi:CRISPR/Cas system-associated endoribonuclease Cas2
VTNALCSGNLLLITSKIKEVVFAAQQQVQSDTKEQDEKTFASLTPQVVCERIHTAALAAVSPSTESLKEQLEKIIQKHEKLKAEREGTLTALKVAKEEEYRLNPKNDQLGHLFAQLFTYQANLQAPNVDLATLQTDIARIEEEIASVLFSEWSKINKEAEDNLWAMHLERQCLTGKIRAGAQTENFLIVAGVV